MVVVGFVERCVNEVCEIVMNCLWCVWVCIMLYMFRFYFSLGLFLVVVYLLFGGG